MSLTMPKRLPKSYPRGTFQALCDYCGNLYYRHSLRRDESGFLACPRDQRGRDTVKLNRMNQEYAAQVIKREDNWDHGNQDTRSLATIVRRTADDIPLY